MILGTYWYLDFPTDLYMFDFFEFRKGYGGHADRPAELVVTFETENQLEIIEDLTKLIENHSDGFLFVYTEFNKMKIGTGGHQLFDYEFLIIEEVEKILKRHKVHLTKNNTFNNPIITRILVEKSQNKLIYPKKGFLQIVGSELNAKNAENCKLRLDCNLDLINKDKFIEQLKECAIEEKLDVFFYFDQDFNDKTNLILFFTNGRQGLNLTPKKYTNTISFENKIENIAKTNNVKFGHISGIDLYPKNGPKIEKIIEQEFIL
jgi:hypothetical protein